MNAIRYLIGCMFILLLCSSMPSRAEDIDIYSGIGGSAGAPNVLLVLDNSASLDASAGPCSYADGSGAPAGGKLFDMEFCALYNAIYALPVNPDGSARVNLGFVMYNATGLAGYGNGNNNCQAVSSNGGCVVKPLTPMTLPNKQAFMYWIKTLTSTAIKSNNEKTAGAMWEAWAYYAGKVGASGLNYSAAQPAATCQKNYVIFIGNAANNVSSPGDPANPSVSSGLSAAYAAAGITQPGIIPIPSGQYGLSPTTVAANVCSTGGSTYAMGTHNDSSGLYADEWARFMFLSDVYGSTTGTQDIITYTIGVLAPTGCKPDYPALLSSMALYGGGKFYPTSAANSGDLTNNILKILNEVQSVNSVFASSSLPVSVNAQGSYLNQIYMGMFRPDPNGYPRWSGNLKQYQFVLNANGSLQLGDAAGQPAISSAGTGFISSYAASFWTCTNSTNPLYSASPYTNMTTAGTAFPCPLTPDPTNGFWNNNPAYVAYSWGKAYDLADGDLVDKGGVGQQLRLANLTATYPTNTTPSQNSPRKLYTFCPAGTGCNCSMGPGGTGGAGCNLTDPSNVFDVSNPAITDTLLGTGQRSVTSIVSAPQVTPTTSPVALVRVSDAAPITITSAATTTDMVTNWPTWIASWYAAGVIDTASAADVAKIGPVGSWGQVNYPSSPAISCNVVVLTPTTFGYATTWNSTWGGGTSTWCWQSANGANSGSVQPPIGPTSAIEYSNTTVTVTTSAAHGLQPNQVLTFNNCSVLTSLNNATSPTVFGTVTGVPSSTTFTAAFPSVWPIGIDTTCIYAPNTARVTSPNYNFPQGDMVNIAGSSVAAYNGTWAITTIDANTFSFQYTAPAPQASASSATATGSTNRTNLINWVRGQDNVGDEPSLCKAGTIAAGTLTCPSTAVTVRPSMHGDVLHSRPSVVDYGGSTGVVAYYGSNDGIYHAVDANQYTFTNSVTGATVTDNNAGQELWGFVPQRYYNRLIRQRTNSPVLLMPSTPTSIVPTPTRKDYFFDGSTSVYQLVNSDGTARTVYIYLSARRGSRTLWAMDVTTPTNPKMLWKIDNAHDSTGAASTVFAELGQTWSSPKVAMVSGYSNPVLIFGAGYDPAEDSEPPTTDTMGRGIFIVDAITGAMVWSASATGTTACSSGTTPPCHFTVTNMTYAIPADITLMDINSDGKIDRLYGADVGGNVWRVDLEPTGGNTPDQWQVEQLAALGCTTGACPAGTTPRKFLFGPEVIKTTAFTAVFVGSGNRESPLIASCTTNPGAAYCTTNRLYMLRDTATGSDGSGLTTITEQTTSGTYNVDDCTGTTSNPNTCSTVSTGASSPLAYSLLSTQQQHRGYYITLNPGEQGVNAPVAFSGYIYFGTNQPTPASANACTGTLGTARGYQVSAFAATYSSIAYSGGGLPPTPVAGVVNIVVNGVNRQMPFLIGGADPTCQTADCKSAFGGHQVKIKVPTNRFRTYRYQEGK